MVIHTEYLNFVVPISLIKLKYPGGWKACLKEHRGEIGKSVWYDNHLFRYGSLDYIDIAEKMKKWELLGFNVVESRGGKKYWADLCIYKDSFACQKEDNIKCDWLVPYKDSFSSVVLGVYLKGQEPGEVIGPRSESMTRMKRKLIKETFRFNFAMYFIFLSALAAVFYYLRDNWY